MLNFRGILQASVKSTVIGVALVLLITLLMIVGHLLGPTPESHTVGLITSGLSVLLIPTFFLLYLWTGFQAKRKYGLSTMESGVAAVLAYAIAGMTNLVFVILSVGGALLMYQFDSPMMEIPFLKFLKEIPFLKEVIILGGVSSHMCCWSTRLAIGVVINFVVGMCGAILSENR